MKSDRRHELQTNTLALWLQLRLPELWNKYGSWFLFGLVTIMALVLFIQYRVKQPKIALANASRTLAEVQSSIGRLERREVPPTELSDVPARIDDAMKQSDQKQIQAYGNILKAEYYWTLATMPGPMPGETAKRPEQSPEELLKQAEEAYQAALAVAPDAQDLVARAHFGLANVAETRGYQPVRTPGQANAEAAKAQFDIAKRNYEAVANNATMLPALKAEANWRLEQLALLQKPVWYMSMPATREGTTLPFELGPELPAGITTSRPTTSAGATRPTTSPAK